MTPEQIKNIRETLDMNQTAFARELGVNQSTVWRLEAGEYGKPGRYLTLVLEKIAKRAEKRTARKASESAG